MSPKTKLPRNLQGIFDKVVEGLASQGFQRSINDDICLYRGPDGLKCAVGWLISDDEYDPRTEGESASTVLGYSLDSGRGRHLNDLQQCHDSGETPELMRTMLRKFARDHRLKFPAALSGAKAGA